MGVSHARTGLFPPGRPAARRAHSNHNLLPFLRSHFRSCSTQVPSRGISASVALSTWAPVFPPTISAPSCPSRPTVQYNPVAFPLKFLKPNDPLSLLSAFPSARQLSMSPFLRPIMGDYLVNCIQSLLAILNALCPRWLFFPKGTSPLLYSIVPETKRRGK